MRIQRSWSYWLRAALPVLALLLVAGPSASSYMYEQDVSTDLQVTNLRCTDIYLPKTVRIEWDYPGLNPSVPATYEVRRKLGGTYTTLGTTTNRYWDDSFSWSWDTSYLYYVRVSADSEASQYERTIPPGTDPSLIYNRKVASGNPNTIFITVRPTYLAAAANQTVDTRLDLRYSSPHYVDHQFGSGIYRGGLFCGFADNPDSSKIARSFIGFTIAQPQNDLFYWTGSLNCYHTRNRRADASTTVNVGVHEVSDSWTESGTVWSTAPSLTPSSPISYQGVTWDPASPVSSWKHFTLRDAFGLALVGDGAVSFGLAATDEGVDTFAYFAKTQWDADYGPRVVYAMGAPSAPLELTASPTSVTGGTTNSTGTVIVNGFRATGTTVNLSSSNTAAATVPSNVSVPAGDTSKTFTITSHSVMTATNVTITATRNGFSETTVVNVHP